MNIEIMTVAQVAKEAGVCLRTARTWTTMQDNPIPSFKIGRCRRILRSSFVEWVKERERAEDNSRRVVQ